MGQADGEDCQTSRGSLFESRPDIEAIDKLLREQESIEERKREENSKKCILDQEVRHCVNGFSLATNSLLTKFANACRRLY